MGIPFPDIISCVEFHLYCTSFLAARLKNWVFPFWLERWPLHQCNDPSKWCHKLFFIYFQRPNTTRVINDYGLGAYTAIDKIDIIHVQPIFVKIYQNIHCYACLSILKNHIYLHLCASVTKQCNLVPDKGVISLAGKVTAGLVESKGSLPPGLWLMSPACWLPRNRDRLRTQRS